MTERETTPAGARESFYLDSASSLALPLFPLFHLIPLVPLWETVASVPQFCPCSSSVSERVDCRKFGYFDLELKQAENMLVRHLRIDTPMSSWSEANLTAWRQSTAVTTWFWPGMSAPSLVTERSSRLYTNTDRGTDKQKRFLCQTSEYWDEVLIGIGALLKSYPPWARNAILGEERGQSG